MPSRYNENHCDTANNNQDCNFDGEDCCKNPNLIMVGFCFVEVGVIESPGYPEQYESNLDWTYLIQVPLGKIIIIHFLVFDVEVDSSCR